MTNPHLSGSLIPPVAGDSASPDIAWRPSPVYLERSRLLRFMRAQGISDYQELMRRSMQDPTWFWDAVSKDLELEWYRPYERVMDAYPVHEALPASLLPDSLAAHRSQHLFRVARGQWPIVQIGPGILSVHEREEYSWKDFVWRCVETASKLVDAYPRPLEFRVEAVRLRYLDAVAFVVAFFGFRFSLFFGLLSPI